MIKLFRIDLENVENFHSHTKVDLGFKAECVIKDMKKSKQISDRGEMELWLKCRKFLFEVGIQEFGLSGSYYDSHIQRDPNPILRQSLRKLKSKMMWAQVT